MTEVIAVRWQRGWVSLRQVRGYTILWAALLAISAALVTSPLPLATAKPFWAVTIATTGGIVGFAVLQLDLLHFYTVGHLTDLYLGLAFGTLGLANLVARVLVPVGVDQPYLETSLDFHLLARGLAAILIVTGLARAATIIPGATRPRVAAQVGGGVGALLLLGGTVIVLAGSNLPPAVDLTTRDLLERGAPIAGPLPGQEPWLLAARLLIVLLLAAATLGSLRLAVQHADRYFARRALALSLLAFGQGHALLVGPLPADYVSTADAFRLAAYVVLLYGLVARMRSDVAERATADERLRLSREIHDGLAQQLALVQLRLGLARDATRSELARAADLATVERLLEGAMLEARGAITTLRTGLVMWDEFTRTVQRFGAEFGQNHEVQICPMFEGSLPHLTSELHVEILRMLHEACSNAVRHGQATQIDIILMATPHGLTVQVRDNGRGFELGTALRSDGVGLRSMVERLQQRAGTFRIESMPGQGATLHLWLPAFGTDGRRR